MRSVLDQRYPKLEYVVMDGGSTDNSPAIIRSYESELKYWKSGGDSGQYDAIQKGFDATTGEIMSWLNSDDQYLPWAFQVVAEIFLKFPQVEWLTTLFPMSWDARGVAIQCTCADGFSRGAFLRGENLPGGSWYGRGWIQQETTFWRRSLWERAGGFIDSSYRYAGDFDLWARFFAHAPLYSVGVPLGGFRKHGNQKTVLAPIKYREEAIASLIKHGGYVARGRLADLESHARGFVQRRLPRTLRNLGGTPSAEEVRPLCLFSDRLGDWELGYL